MSNTVNFDWMTDLDPLFKGQQSWFEGSYQRATYLHVVPDWGVPFFISCGAGLIAEHIRRFRFSPAIIQRLGQVTDAQGRSLFQESYLNHLQRLRLRLNVKAAPEGTLLLPGEPLLIVQGSWMQVLLMESAIRLLVWDSTYWATQAALVNWENKQFVEEDTPATPAFPFNPIGWKNRATYIGGGDVTDVEQSPTWPGLAQISNETQQPLAQVRRLFKREHPLGDVWMTPEEDNHASVSRTHIDFHDQITDHDQEVLMTRFQNLYQPLLLKGHPIFASNSTDYLRQRTWKQLEAFSQVNLEAYPRGWYQAMG